VQEVSPSWGVSSLGSRTLLRTDLEYAEKVEWGWIQRRSSDSLSGAFRGSRVCRCVEDSCARIHRETDSVSSGKDSPIYWRFLPLMAGRHSLKVSQSIKWYLGEKKKPTPLKTGLSRWVVVRKRLQVLLGPLPPAGASFEIVQDAQNHGQYYQDDCSGQLKLTSFLSNLPSA
jgi:hypothetical protein